MSVDDTIFQYWLLDHQPKDEMLYKKGFWDTYVFWRDHIIPLFLDHTKNISWEDKCKSMDSYTEIVGEHTSKSIVHPVLKIEYHSVKIIFRYNFYDYEIAVIGNIPVNIPIELLNTDSFFYQGFPDEYIIKTPYSTDNNRTFIAGVNNHYQFYTFMFLLKSQIDIYNGGINQNAKIQNWNN